MKIFLSFFASHKFFASFYLAMTVAFSGYTSLPQTLLAFALITTIDTITSINAGAHKKGLKFNPFKLYFWKEIKSGLIRVWLQKVFKEYMVYVILAFILDILILEKKMYIEILFFKLSLPIVVLWMAIGVELWSIGENIGKTGRKNYIKIFFQWLEGYLRGKFNLKPKNDAPKN